MAETAPLLFPKVLVTGAGGWIGQHTCRELERRGHTVRGLDVAPMPQLSDAVVGSIADMDTVRRAASGMDAIVHLAATPDDADFMSLLLPNNIIGVYNIFEAARELGIKRVVGTSSVQVVMGLPWTKKQIRLEDTPYPLNLYAASKVFQEAVGRVYAHNCDMSVIVIRPGWVPRARETVERIKTSEASQSMYFSPEDSGRCFADAVAADKVKFAVVFGTSRSPTYQPFDLEPTRMITGYEPQHKFPQGLPEFP